jgi:hypothetical protein
MADPQNQPIFREVQKWSPAVRLLFLLSSVQVALVGGVAMYLAARRDFSDIAPPLLIAVLVALLSLGFGVLLWVNRLETEIRADGVYIRLFPFNLFWQWFPAQELSECYARRYHPILEYGGWGIRYGWHGRAYNMSGREGVQLVFQDGRRLLLGSKEPRQLEAAIRSVMNGNPVEPAGVRR